jgi:hypothetical protein
MHAGMGSKIAERKMSCADLFLLILLSFFFQKSEARIGRVPEPAYDKELLNSRLYASSLSGELPFHQRPRYSMVLAILTLPKALDRRMAIRNGWHR